MKRTFAAEAQDKKAGMSLGEIRQFIQSLDVQNIPDDTQVKVHINFGGTLKSMAVTEEPPPPTITVDPPAPGTSPWN